ncbi:hypothetical protein BKA61DRAFT_710149 [Leptodontidium sp. MPI-SDFR-AT-0119]|nr:hypothetical protein BKA61DRAFT_710149 [Leptodontidium sp. MPI-SDFR-AT-0119]
MQIKPPTSTAPPSTAILIGHILTDPALPYESLNTDSHTPAPPSTTLTTTKTGFLATRSQLSSGKFGIWAQVLEGAFGGMVGHSFDNSQDLDFEIDEIETSFMKPAGKETKEYLRGCVEDGDVQAFLEESRFKKSVYMIVGLKIAKGAKVRKGSERSSETTAQLMIDGTAGGVPVKAGPEVEIKKDRQESTEWIDEKSFVFAYRLRKITCKKGKIVEDVEYNKGAFLDLESSVDLREEKGLHYLVENEDVDLEGKEGKEEIDEEEEATFLWPAK